MQQEKNKSHKGDPHKATSFFFFSSRNIAGKKGEARYI